MMPDPVACYADPSVPAGARGAGVPWCDSLEEAEGDLEPIPEAAGSIIIVLATDVPLLPTLITHKMPRNYEIDPLISASGHATEEAIFNAMFAAETLTGINGHTVAALPHGPPPGDH